MFGDSARFFDSEDCLEDNEGIEGTAQSTNYWPRCVFTMDGSHCTTFDFCGLYFPISGKYLMDRNVESRQTDYRLYIIQTCGSLQGLQI